MATIEAEVVANILAVPSNNVRRVLLDPLFVANDAEAFSNTVKRVLLDPLLMDNEALAFINVATDADKLPEAVSSIVTLELNDPLAVE